MRCSALLVLLLFPGALQAGGEPKVTRLTNLVSAYPMPCADGTKVVFQSNRTGRFEIFTMKPDGSQVTQLTNRPGDNVTPAFSPNCARIAFAAAPDENSDIYVMNADGSDVRRLTDHPGDDSHPHWSADGGRIIFNSARTTPDLQAPWGRQWHEVFSISVDGRDLQQHTQCRTVCTYPSFSPDGTRIAYRKIVNTPGFHWDLDAAERNSEVFVSGVHGDNEINISKSAAFDGWPAWSPDGKQVAFSSNRSGPANVGQIYLVNADGSGLRAVTTGPWSYVQPQWSSDGKIIYAYWNVETSTYEFGDVVAIELP